MLTLRRSYGSGPLEEFNAQLYPYRRNVAGAVILTLFAVQSALATKMPLPQFMPSARLAHLRMVNKVREVVTEAAVEQGERVGGWVGRSEGGAKGEKGGGRESAGAGTGTDANASNSTPPKDSQERDPLRHLAVRRKYLAFNASSAAQAEIIEFLEELVELSKLLVGANEFRSGLFVRPALEEYNPPPLPSPAHPSRSVDIGKADAPQDGAADNEAAHPHAPTRDVRGGRVRAATELPTTLILSNEEVGGGQRLWRRRGTTVSSTASIGEGEGVASLERIRSRRIAGEGRRGV